MPNRPTAAALLVIALVATTLGPALPVRSSHNSLGANHALVQPDEVIGDGTLRPDVPDRRRPAFHDELPDPRRAPPDQTGERYTDCVWEIQYGRRDAYHEDLRNGQACYVGYVDVQWLYVVPSATGGHVQDGDPLYRANPHPDDEYCTQGLLTRLERAATDPRCDGDGHRGFAAHEVRIDTDLVEAATQGDGNAPGLSDVTVTAEDSGTITYPLFVQPVVLLFGEPHPDAPDLDRPRAGEGLFGPNPIVGGNPFADLTGACGARTERCELLTPYDLFRYDAHPVDGWAGRVCSYRPGFEALDTGWTVRPCGPRGTPMSYVGPHEDGGLELDVADTHLPFPGWYGRWYVFPGGEATSAVQAVDASVTEADVREGLTQIVAVNPDVPEAADPLWCVRPNVLAEDAHGNVAVHGTYRADAIDVDRYRSAFHRSYEQVDEVTPDDAVDGTAGAEDATATVPGALPAPSPGGEAVDRADFVESPEDEPPAASGTVDWPAGARCRADGTLDPSAASRTVDTWVRIDARARPSTVPVKDPTLRSDGLPAPESETTGTWQADAFTLDGRVEGVVDTNLDGDADACQTRRGPVRADRDRCGWRPRNGVVVAAFQVTGPLAVQPKATRTADSEALATGRSRVDDATRPAGALLDAALESPEAALAEAARIAGDGADRVARPFEMAVPSDGDVTWQPWADTGRSRDALEAPMDRVLVVGETDITAQNCVILIRGRWLDDVIDAHPAFDSRQELEDALCDRDETRHGEVRVIESGLFPHDRLRNRGGFESTVRLVRLLPAPNEVGEHTGGLAAGDEVCVSVAATVEDLGPALAGPTAVRDCDPLTGKRSGGG